LYAFGEKMQDSKLKNTLMEAMHALWCHKQSDGSLKTPDPGSVVIIYDGTAGSCPPRQLIVQLYARRCRPVWTFGTLDDYPLEFIRDPLKELASFPKPVGDLPWKDRAQYQEAE
jgi:hypothetical protein